MGKQKLYYFVENDFSFIENDSTKENELDENNNIEINKSYYFKEFSSDLDIEKNSSSIKAKLI